MSVVWLLTTHEMAGWMEGGMRDRCGDGRVASEDDRDHREYMNHVGGALTLLC